MATSIHQDARAVLLPAFESLTVADWMRRTVREGTRVLLIGESRDEYVAREMTDERRATESVGSFVSFTSQLDAESEAGVAFAVDQEPWGIRRLHDLVPPYVDPSDAAFPSSCREVAGTARSLGVNVFLAPVLDELRGNNPWLSGRTLPADAGLITRAATEFVRGTQGAGALTVVKHFPGFPAINGDPAEVDCSVSAGAWDEELLAPFRAAVEAGTRAVMLGPAVVHDVDPVQPASTSVPTVSVLREQLGFEGLIVTDDLDAPATLRGRSLTQTAVAAIAAGANLLLLAGGDHLDHVVAVLREEAEGDADFRTALRESAERVRRFASELRASTSPN